MSGAVYVKYIFLRWSLPWGWDFHAQKKTENFCEDAPVRESQNFLHYALPLQRCSGVRLHERNFCDFKGMLYECSKQYPKSDPEISHPHTLGKASYPHPIWAELEAFSSYTERRNWSEQKPLVIKTSAALPSSNWMPCAQVLPLWHRSAPGPEHSSKALAQCEGKDIFFFPL